DRAASETSTTFGLFLIALPASAFSVIFATLFLVQSRTRISMYLGFANVVLNIALNFAFRPLWGVAGIALSTSLPIGILNGAQGAAAHRLWGRSVAYPPLRVLAAVGVAILVATPLAFAVLHSMSPSETRLHALLVSTVVGGVGLSAYGAALLA